MKSIAIKKKGNTISNKRPEEKNMTEQDYVRIEIIPEDDPYRNNPEYFADEGINSLRIEKENK